MAVEFDLSFLKELEREKVLDVLYRDQTLQKAEEERIRKLKTHLQQLRWKGAKSTCREYQERSCARCQKALGRLVNRGAVCNGCSHRVCHDCQVYRLNLLWKCTVCNAHGEVKLKTGEWFLEEKEKKFPCAGKPETVGCKLLKSYQKMNKISVVPPTPPPFSEAPTAVYYSGDLSNSKGFHKSVENIFLSLTTKVKRKLFATKESIEGLLPENYGHINKPDISKSQNDMISDRLHLSTDFGGVAEKRWERSHSDTAITISSQLEKSVSLCDLIHKAREQELQTERSPRKEAEEIDSSQQRVYGGLKQSSMSSINSVCTDGGSMDNGSVTGEIEFAVVYNLKTSVLSISIKACKNLANGEEKKKKCNPYVKTYLLPDKSSASKMKTSVKKSTVDPLFNETLKYTIERSQLETRTLQVSVWHSSTLKRKVFLGEVIIPLELWDFEDNSTQAFNWYQLKSKKHDESIVQYHGELRLKMRLEIPPLSTTLCYSSNGKYSKHLEAIQLHLVILGAKNLLLRPDGFLSPFVKSCLILPNKHELKQRTPALKRETCPEWNYTIIYNIVTVEDLKSSRLDLTVWDQGLNERFLGGTTMGRGDVASNSIGHQSAQLLWQQLLMMPNEWVEDSLVLHSNKRSFYY